MVKIEGKHSKGVCGRPWELEEPEMAPENKLKLSRKRRVSFIEHLLSPGPVLGILLITILSPESLS